MKTVDLEKKMAGFHSGAVEQLFFPFSLGTFTHCFYQGVASLLFLWQLCLFFLQMSTFSKKASLKQQLHRLPCRKKALTTVKIMPATLGAFYLSQFFLCEEKRW